MLNKTQSDLEEKAAAPLERPGISVLLIEDDTVDCLAIQRDLEGNLEVNFQITAVSRLEEGIAQLKIDAFDVVGSGNRLAAAN